METVRHFLLDCPHYIQEQHVLQKKLYQNTGSLSFLLSSPIAVLPLLKFVHTTGRFKVFFSKDVIDKIHTNAQHNGELQQAVDKPKLAIKKAVSDKHKQALAHQKYCIRGLTLANNCLHSPATSAAAPPPPSPPLIPPYPAFPPFITLLYFSPSPLPPHDFQWLCFFRTHALFKPPPILAGLIAPSPSVFTLHFTLCSQGSREEHVQNELG